MKRMKTTLNLSYDRLFLIESLEKTRENDIKKNEEYQKSLKQAAIRKLKADIAAIKAGTGDVAVYVNEGELRGTYYSPTRSHNYNNLVPRIDMILKQLKLSDAKKIRLGQRDTEWILQFLDIPE